MPTSPAPRGGERTHWLGFWSPTMSSSAPPRRQTTHADSGGTPASEAIAATSPSAPHHAAGNSSAIQAFQPRFRWIDNPPPKPPGGGPWLRHDNRRPYLRPSPSQADIAAEMRRRIAAVQQWHSDLSCTVAADKAREWETNFQALQDYTLRQGHTDVKITLNTVHYPLLGRWVFAQRAAYQNERRRAQHLAPYSNERLSVVQIARLEVLEMRWTPTFPITWEEKFELLKQFVAEHRTLTACWSCRYVCVCICCRTCRRYHDLHCLVCHLCRPLPSSHIT